MSMTTTIIQRTLRVPLASDLPAGDGAPVARQLDAALLSVGFTLSGELLDTLVRTEPGAALDIAVPVLRAVRELVGDHVRHNVYFRDFPDNVPDTLEFWQNLLAKTLVQVGEGAAVRQALVSGGRLNLLELPGYGTYQHSYEEMAATRAAFLPRDTDRLTVLHRGDTPERETTALYLALAGSTVPLSEQDQLLLRELAARCADGEQPTQVPIREHRALINQARLPAHQPVVDTVTDVLRLTCALSGGDVTLRTPTRFRSLARWERRCLLVALDNLVRAEPAKLADVGLRREVWKRLGERLHPHEYHALAGARMVFGAARGEELVVPTITQRMERAFRENDLVDVVRTLRTAPGLLVRNLDRLLRHQNAYLSDVTRYLTGASLAKPLEQVSGRVLFSLYEHLLNRTAGTPIEVYRRNEDSWTEPAHYTGALVALPTQPRIFTNQAGRAWVTPDTRRPLNAETRTAAMRTVEIEIARRLPFALVVDEDMRDVALPLSGRAMADGFRTLPRGSAAPLAGDTLRMFVYWRQREQCTDFDLSALLLDEHFTYVSQVSYTNIRHGSYIRHSGDITQAPDGASEFIDVSLDLAEACYIVPQVNVYAGEGFAEVAESFVGHMSQDGEQRGLPFEPSTVRTRSDLRGAGQVALPLVFEHTEAGWRAVWTHLYLKGMARMNRVEANRMSTALLIRSILGRQYLTLGRLADILERWHDGPQVPSYASLERPDTVSPKVTVYTPENLTELIPQ